MSLISCVIDKSIWISPSTSCVAWYMRTCRRVPSDVLPRIRCDDYVWHFLLPWKKKTELTSWCICAGPTYLRYAGKTRWTVNSKFWVQCYFHCHVTERLELGLRVLDLDIRFLVFSFWIWGFGIFNWPLDLRWWRKKKEFRRPKKKREKKNWKTKKFRHPKKKVRKKKRKIDDKEERFFFFSPG